MVISSGGPGQLPFREHCIIRPAQARRHLGSDLPGAAIICHDGFDPDALGILSGSIRAGGILVLCTPSLADWPTATGRSPGMPNYISRIARILADSALITRITQDGTLAAPISAQAPHGRSEPDFRDQQAAIAAVRQVVSGQRRRPTVLEADRGRGKSAALGIAAAQLLQSGYTRIAVTGLNRASVGTLLAHAVDQAPDSACDLPFYAPDRLIREEPDLELLLVDEAATLPLPMLERLLRRYSRIAFASTVHGYEGTGRGFVLKFHQVLDRLTRGWRHVRLEEPIRWADGDPLDRLTRELLVLDAEPDTASGPDAQAPPRFQYLAPQALVQDEDLLRDVFALLTQAHYRTRPADLVRLLDGENLRLFRLHERDQTLAVCLVAEEGDLPDEMVAPVWTNRRRPPHNLLPEVLCAQLGFADALSLSAVRVVRIAVKQPLRRMGLGSRLLDQVKRHYRGKADFLGTSYGLEESLLDFWQKNRFELVRIGLGKSHNTGTHSAVMLQGVSERGRSLAERAADKLGRNLPLQLPVFLKEMEPDMAWHCIRHLQARLPLQEPDHRDLAELAGFAAGSESPASVIAAMTRIAWLALARHPGSLERCRTGDCWSNGSWPTGPGRTAAACRPRDRAPKATAACAAWSGNCWQPGASDGLRPFRAVRTRTECRAGRPAGDRFPRACSR